MIGRFKLFCLSSLRLPLQHLSSLPLFPLQKLVDVLSGIKVGVGASVLFVNYWLEYDFQLQVSVNHHGRDLMWEVVIVNEDKRVVSAHVRNALVYT